MSAYRLDKRNAKLMGVCAGFANATGIDALVIRIGLVVVALCGLAPVAIVTYLAIGWIASDQPA